MPARYAPTNGKRTIFCLTSGRSGTAYLAHILQVAKDTLVFHEPEPAFQNVMRTAQTQPAVAATFVRDEKLPFIRSLTANIYVELSHLFAKGFVEHFVNEGLVPDVFILTRPWREVAASMYSLDTIPGRSDRALRYYLSPGDPTVRSPSNWEQLSDYQLCYWYCLETERRQNLYSQLLQGLGAATLKISLKELTTPSGFARVLRFVTGSRPSLGCWWWYTRQGRKPKNSKESNKKKKALPVDVEEQELEVRRRFAISDFT